jgi:CheY-like chemotaxis protein/HPt (histidine-containing phosphotransfer) domain-containing protein
VVDDVEINRELLRIILEKRGHRITMAQNGEDAVNQFQKNEFDIIFMDMQMPVLDGYGAVRRIREIEQERTARRTPIIAMTAYAMQGDREKCLTADMDYYLAKPAKPADIVAALTELVPGTGAGGLQAEPGYQNDSPSIKRARDHSASDTSPPVFDRNELLERLGGREELLGRFIGMFTKNVIGYLELLKSAIDLGDGEQIRIQAHTIKGAAANIAAHRIRESAAAMESFAREGNIGDAAGLLATLTSELKAFHNEAAL